MATDKELQENWIVNMKILDEIRTKYPPLLEIVKTNYRIKICPECSGKKLSFENVSATGHTITCKCTNCSKEQTFSILPNKDGSIVVHKLDEIKYLMGSFKKPVNDAFWKEDVDNTFVVDIDPTLNSSSDNVIVELMHNS
ncbi:MAG: hypothetical protein JXB00_09375 [Bacteroidales bacterium]|nr:hypothetical protein [Bacteroidales bacterium]